MIIGAGTGGLALAHGLVREGIDVAVYERDRTRRDGLQGYRVGISPDGSRALHALLPADLYSTFVATCARQPRSLTFLDERLRALLSIGVGDGLEVGDDPVESEKSVSRMTLRQVLLTGLEEVVQFDKAFSHYQERPDGRVEACFEDGTSVVADLLVGADGTSSRVRRQLLPQAQLKDTGIVGIAGKVLLTDEVRGLLTPPLWRGVSIVLAPRGYGMVSHTMEFPWGDGGPKEGVGRTEADLIERWPGLLFDNTRDYFMWGFSGSRRRLPFDPMALTGAELIERVLAVTPEWHPDLRRLFELADPSATFPLAIRTSTPVEPWPTGPVTLIGDAIHTMTPGRGVGANTALLDALLLCHQLVEAREGRLGQRESVAAYERSMIQYGFEAVEESLKQMTDEGAVHHPLWGGPALAGTKAMLRLVDRVPPMKRRMAESETRLRDRRRHPALAAVGA
ncbi:MAG: FAD-dependent monooxygenase [Candidatus Dormibacteraeota bacterium]|nr:FAD-dependent monooxygenase [Candidatus Dormibacteraeota bacterium]